MGMCPAEWRGQGECGEHWEEGSPKHSTKFQAGVGGCLRQNEDQGWEESRRRGFTGRAQNEDELRLELGPLLSNSSRILRHP